MSKPSDWKNYDDFAAGIDANRLPTTDALAGQTFDITLKDGTTLSLAFKGKDLLSWSQEQEKGEGSYEAVNVGDNVYFVDATFASRPRDAWTLIINTRTRRVLSILSHVRTEDEKVDGEPLVTQKFDAGVLGDPSVAPEGMEPAPTRDLIGLRAFYRYSPNHLYEHIYMSSQRYGWQCLVGEQKGHGDVDMASTYKFDENQYLFTFREFIIPVASVFFYNWDQMRSTGKFLGVTGEGKVENNAAGAFIQNASMTYYNKAWQPV